jgi:hypothetical protein
MIIFPFFPLYRRRIPALYLKVARGAIRAMPRRQAR